MKDAFGGSFILRIMLTFFVIFICFMTVSITISKTFRIKNTVINILERSDPDKLNKGDDSTKIRIDNYLQKNAYNYFNNKKVSQNCKEQGDSNNSILTQNGVCIVSHSSANNSSIYYKVTAYIVVDFPLFHLGIVIPISGETKTIYK